MVKHEAVPDGSTRAAIAIQIAILSGGGICVLALAIADMVTRRDAGSWLLGSWVGGTFIFAAFLNWTVSGRTLLPMAVPVGILVARRLEERLPADTKACRLEVAGALLAGAALSWSVARSDFLLARAARETVQAVIAQYGHGQTTLWFEGHWGFQH